MNTPLRRSGMARALKGSHSFTCTPRVHPLTEWTIPAFPSQLKLVLIYRPRRDGRLSWPSVAGWLHTEINVRHRQLNPDTVAHLSTSCAWYWLTLLIKANALTNMPDHQHNHKMHIYCGFILSCIIFWYVLTHSCKYNEIYCKCIVGFLITSFDFQIMF